LEQEFVELSVVQFCIRAYHITRALLLRYTLLGCFLAFNLIAFLGDTNMFNIGYLMIFYAYLVFYYLNAGSVAKYVWPAVCLYPALIATLCYIYQFQELQDFLGTNFVESHWHLDGSVGTPLLIDIGLLPKSGTALFRFLLQHVATLCACVFQYRVFRQTIFQSGTKSVCFLSFSRWRLVACPRAVIILVNRTTFSPDYCHSQLQAHHDCAHYINELQRIGHRIHYASVLAFDYGSAATPTQAFTPDLDAGIVSPLCSYR
jgi:hypothetical protein